MSTPKKSVEARLHDLLWLNHALALEKHALMNDLKKAHDEIAALKAKSPTPSPRAGIRP